MKELLIGAIGTLGSGVLLYAIAKTSSLIYERFSPVAEVVKQKWPIIDSVLRISSPSLHTQINPVAEVGRLVLEEEGLTPSQVNAGIQWILNKFDFKSHYLADLDSLTVEQRQLSDRITQKLFAKFAD